MRQTPTSKLIDRINQELPEIPITQEDEIIFFRGRRDAGEYRWFTKGIPCVCSSETITELLKAKKLGYILEDNIYIVGDE